MPAEFEILKTQDGKKFYWRFKAANGEIVATSETYASKQSCIKGIDSIKSDSKTAKIQDQTQK